ncbi:DegV family protein [Aerococcus agrisoli]|uniref:DegV family protein n=1 Tax=Aerococcus agrisoli TaxID=2487350 RepID=A0A3N4G4C3_9LACT|nr:DegV family protein [Aerococcus agrisoli]RPA57763.1 DegV family protein [Aerococcus agrisoli]
MKTAIIVDSTATLPEDLSALDNIFQIKLSVIFPDGEVREDSSDPQVIADFYDALPSFETLPTTSQPTNGQIYAVYEDILAQSYDQVFAIGIAKKLSGTLPSLEGVAKEFADKVPTYVIDSLSTSQISVHLIRECLRLLDAGYDAKAIVPALNQAARDSATYVIVGSLDNLVKGGRLSAAGAFFGNLLKIIPLLEINNEGSIEVIDKIRTERKLKEKFVGIYEQAVLEHGNRVHIALAHGNALDRGLDIVGTMSPDIKIDQVPVSMLTPVVGTHVGTGCIGIFILVDTAL